MSIKVVIIGGVATGPKTAARLRRLDPEADITLIERQDVLSYAGCGMPYFIEDVIKEYDDLLGGDKLRDVAFFRRTKNIHVLDKTEALKINRKQKTVTVKDLRTDEDRDIPYDKLVLGVGARPFVPRIEGVDLEGVYRLYNPRQALAIKNAVDAGAKDVVIVGGGLIGIETCGAFIERGCNVSIFEMMPYLVPNLMDKEMVFLVEKYLRDKDVTIVSGSPVSRIVGENGKAVAVETGDGRKIKADMVVVAVGVRPNTELAVEAGLDVGPTRAIAVNENLQTSDPDIYAGGDCVENTNLLTGEKVYVPMGSTANKHGRIIADNINGVKSTWGGVTSTAVFKLLDYNCGSTGLTEKRAKELGYNVVTSYCPKRDFSEYIPGNKFFVLKLVVDSDNRKVLGCQVVGDGDGVKRIDVVATTIRFSGTIDDLAEVDLAYAPAYSTAMDPLAHAANVVKNKLDGHMHGLSPPALWAKLERGDDFMFVDCRGPDEYNVSTIELENTVNIPLPLTREKFKDVPRDREIITFCNTSITAYNQETILRNMGFTNVKVLEGSIKGWPYDLKP